MKRIVLYICALMVTITGVAFAHEEGNSPQYIKCVAQLFGHPVHPMLVVFPLALFITSLVFDAIYIYTKDSFWHKSAYYLILAGIIGGMLAAIPGFIDYFTAIPEGTDADEVAELHWHLNAIVLVLFFVNIMLRRRRDSPRGRGLAALIALSIAGVAIMLVAAWYGGHLIYAHRVGVSPVLHIHSH